jgi:hypothetical protein
LYFTGKLLVGGSKSFWALFILIILPYPAKFGSDVLRDWPHVLFLACGFLFLLWAAQQSIWWMFGVAGLAAGLGHIIRLECAQLVIYGVLWLLGRLSFARPDTSRRSVLLGLVTLLVGFSVPFVPYVKARGRVLPLRLRQLIRFSEASQQHTDRSCTFDNQCRAHANAGLPGDASKAIGRLIREISDDLAHFFLPVLLLGIFLRFRRKSASETERFFVSALIAFNIIIMLLLYHNHGYISRRHCLPLVVFSIFYVPIGLEFLGNWLARVLFKTDVELRGSRRDGRLWFLVLLVAGAAVCLPKLLEPLHAGKHGYVAAAEWIKENTAEKDRIATPDRRISFYAERRGLVYDKTIPNQATYIVRITDDEKQEPNFGRGVREEYSVWENKRRPGGKRVVIHKVL